SWRWRSSRRCSRSPSRRAKRAPHRGEMTGAVSAEEVTLPACRFKGRACLFPGKGKMMSTTQVVPVNYWPDTACAKAFWGQHELPAYRRLLADTTAWLDPQPFERWIDLGCGGGQLTRALWEKSNGTLAEIVALDCAAA